MAQLPLRYQMSAVSSFLVISMFCFLPCIRDNVTHNSEFYSVLFLFVIFSYYSVH